MIDPNVKDLTCIYYAAALCILLKLLLYECFDQFLVMSRFEISVAFYASCFELSFIS